MTRAAREEWVLATTNPGKLEEFSALLADTPIKLKALDAGGDVPEETGASFVENALIKARHAARQSGQPAMADDSGLCVAALDGAPGVHSARFAGPAASDRQNLELLLEKMVEAENREAAFYCVIVAVRKADDPAPIVATGRWPGLIAEAPAGSNGFGYDPVFFDPETGSTAAELEPSEKNAISHRSRACRELKRMLAI